MRGEQTCDLNLWDGALSTYGAVLSVYSSITRSHERHVLRHLLIASWHLTGVTAICYF